MRTIFLILLTLGLAACGATPEAEATQDPDRITVTGKFTKVPTSTYAEDLIKYGLPPSAVPTKEDKPEEKAEEKADEQTPVEIEVAFTLHEKPADLSFLTFANSSLWIEKEDEHSIVDYAFDLEDATRDGESFTWNDSTGLLEADGAGLVAKLTLSSLDLMGFDEDLAYDDETYFDTELEHVEGLYWEATIELSKHLNYSQNTRMREELKAREHEILVRGKVAHISGTPLEGALPNFWLYAIDNKTNDICECLYVETADDGSFELKVVRNPIGDDFWEEDEGYSKPHKGINFFATHDRYGEPIKEKRRTFMASALPIQWAVLPGAFVSWDVNAYYPPYDEVYGIQWTANDEHTEFTLSDIVIRAPLVDVKINYDLGDAYIWESDYNAAIARGENPSGIPLKEPEIELNKQGGWKEYGEPSTASFRSSRQDVEIEYCRNRLRGSSRKGFHKRIFLAAEDWEVSFYTHLDHVMDNGGVTFTAKKERITLDSGEFRQLEFTLTPEVEEEEEEEPSATRSVELEIPTSLLKAYRPRIEVHYGYVLDEEIEWVERPLRPLPDNVLDTTDCILRLPKETKYFYAYLSFVDMKEAKRFGQEKLRIGDSEKIDLKITQTLSLGKGISLSPQIEEKRDHFVLSVEGREVGYSFYDYSASRLVYPDSKTTPSAIESFSVGGKAIPKASAKAFRHDIKGNLKLHFGALGWAVKSVSMAGLRYRLAEGEESFGESLMVYAPPGEHIVEIYLREHWVDGPYQDWIVVKGDGISEWQMPEQIGPMEIPYLEVDSHRYSISRTLEGKRAGILIQCGFPVGNYFIHIRDNWGQSVTHQITLRAGETKLINLAGPKRSARNASIRLKLSDARNAKKLRRCWVGYDTEHGEGGYGFEQSSHNAGYHRGDFVIKELPHGVPLKFTLWFDEGEDGQPEERYLLEVPALAPNQELVISDDRLQALCNDDDNNEGRDLAQRLYGDIYGVPEGKAFHLSFRDSKGKYFSTQELLMGENYTMVLTQSALPEGVDYADLEMPFRAQRALAFTEEQRTKSAEWLKGLARARERD